MIRIPPNTLPAPNPQPANPVKTILFLAVVSLFLSGSAWIHALPDAGRAGPRASNSVDLPIGRDVTVLLDPVGTSKPVIAGDANITTGLDAPDVVKGKVLQMDDRWIVLHADIGYDWIPLEKVLMIHHDE